MNTADLQSAETPAARVAALTDGHRATVLQMLVESILTGKDTRRVPDILQAACLLSQFEMYDCDAAWTDLEDEVRQANLSLGWPRRS